MYMMKTAALESNTDFRLSNLHILPTTLHTAVHVCANQNNCHTLTIIISTPHTEALTTHVQYTIKM